MQPGQGSGKALVVAREAAEARQPGEGALDDPAPGQPHEAAPGLDQLNYRQPDAPGLGVGGRLRAGVALVGLGQLDMMLGGGLHRFSQRSDLGAFTPRPKLRLGTPLPAKLRFARPCHLKLCGASGGGPGRQPPLSLQVKKQAPPGSDREEQSR